MASIIVANWKMRLGVRESVALARGVLRQTRGLASVPDIVLAPSAVALGEVAKAVGRSRVRVAAQSMGPEEKGPYTGQESVKALREAGARAVIIGHSEQRLHQGETDHEVNKKLALALAHNLKPIICFGEPSAVREAGETLGYVHDQLTTILEGHKMGARTDILFAYEPIWAIGSGVTPSIHDVVEVHRAVHKQLHERGLDQVKVLYGGSVSPENAYEFLQHDLVDGALVGTKSVTIRSLMDIIHVAAELM